MMIKYAQQYQYMPGTSVESVLRSKMLLKISHGLVHQSIGIPISFLYAVAKVGIIDRRPTLNTCTRSHSL